MSLKFLLFILVLLCKNSLEAGYCRLYGEWSFLGCSSEKLKINDYLKKTYQYDDIKQNGHKDYVSFSFYKSFKFFEIGATSEIEASYKFNDKNSLSIFITRTNIIYDFIILELNCKKLIMFDKLSNSYCYFLKNKNSRQLPKIKNNTVRN